MNEYKNAVFDAIMWSQAVENLVRDCILKCVANNKLSPSDTKLEKIKNTYGLGGLAYEFKPCITLELFEKLIGFSKDRNILAHDAANRYMIDAMVGITEEEMQKELWKLNSNKMLAGEIYGELLDLHTRFTT